MAFWCQCEASKYCVTCEQLNWFVLWWQCMVCSNQWYSLQQMLLLIERPHVIGTGKSEKRKDVWIICDAHIQKEIFTTSPSNINNVGLSPEYSSKWISLGRFEMFVHSILSEVEKQLNGTTKEMHPDEGASSVFFSGCCCCCVAVAETLTPINSWTVKENIDRGKGVKWGHLCRRVVCSRWNDI